MLSEQCLSLQQAHKPNLTWITLLHCNERKLLLLITSYLKLQNVTSAAMYNLQCSHSTCWESYLWIEVNLVKETALL